MSGQQLIREIGRSGVAASAVGLGTWAIGGWMWGGTDEKESIAAIQASLDLRAAHFVGVHWGTFALAREPYDEPPHRLTAEIERRHLDPAVAWVLKPGETRRW